MALSNLSLVSYLFRIYYIRHILCIFSPRLALSSQVCPLVRIPCHVWRLHYLQMSKTYLHAGV